jgi:hypothetical protein
MASLGRSFSSDPEDVARGAAAGEPRPRYLTVLMMIPP